MKRTFETNDPAMPFVSAVGTGACALITAAMMPALLPFAPLLFPFFLKLGKAGMAHELEEETREEAEAIAKEWMEDRKPGENGIAVTAAKYDGDGSSSYARMTYQFDCSDFDYLEKIQSASTHANALQGPEPKLDFDVAKLLEDYRCSRRIGTLGRKHLEG